MKKIFACLITMMLLVGAVFAEEVVIFEPGVTPVKGAKIAEPRVQLFLSVLLL